MTQAFILSSEHAFLLKVFFIVKMAHLKQQALLTHGPDKPQNHCYVQ